MKPKSRLLYGIDDKPSFWLSTFLGLQHVVMLFSGSIIMPIIICKSTGTSAEQTQYIVFATIVLTAISSLIQIRKVGKIGAGYLLFVGSSGAYWGAVASTVELKGWAFVAVLSLLSAPIEVLLSYTYKYFRKIITPLVGGIVILMISISILPLMMKMWIGEPTAVDYCSGNRLLIGGITLLATIIFASLQNPKFRIWSVIVGMIAGVITSIFVGEFNTEMMNSVDWIGIPKGKWPGLDFDFSTTTLTLLLSFIIATIASTIESIGDSITVQKLSDPNFKKIDYESVQGCLYADAVGNALSGLAGSVPNTTYSGNIAAIELTGVASKKVGYYAIAILLLIAFFPKIAYLFVYIPDPILGASSVVVMGTLASAAIQLLGQEKFDYRNSILVGTSISIGLLASHDLLFPAYMPAALHPLFSDGITISGFTAIIINGIFVLTKTKNIQFKLSKNIDQMNSLKEEINNQALALNLSDETKFKLELVLEELFVFICNQNITTDSNKVKISFFKESDKIEVEISDSDQLDDIDQTELTPDFIETDFDKIGLLIANKLSNELKHIRISNENFISFSIPL